MSIVSHTVQCRILFINTLWKDLLQLIRVGLSHIVNIKDKSQVICSIKGSINTHIYCLIRSRSTIHRHYSHLEHADFIVRICTCIVGINLMSFNSSRGSIFTPEDIDKCRLINVRLLSICCTIIFKGLNHADLRCSQAATAIITYNNSHDVAGS